MAAPGLRFCPTDLELISWYLTKKRAGDHHFLLPGVSIREASLYGDQAQTPQQLFDLYYSPNPEDLPHPSDSDLYFFALIFNKYSRCDTKIIDRTVGLGDQYYWRVQRSEEVFRYPLDPKRRQTVGYKTSLSFTAKGKRSTSGWVMHEYSLLDSAAGPRKDKEWVLCRIRRNKTNAKDAATTQGAATQLDCGADLTSKKRPRQSAAAGTCNKRVKLPPTQPSTPEAHVFNDTPFAEPSDTEGFGVAQFATSLEDFLDEEDVAPLEPLVLSSSDLPPPLESHVCHDTPFVEPSDTGVFDVAQFAASLEGFLDEEEVTPLEPLVPSSSDLPPSLESHARLEDATGGAAFFDSYAPSETGLDVATYSESHPLELDGEYFQSYLESVLYMSDHEAC